MLNIHTEETPDGFVICRPVGELDAFTVSQFRQALADLASSKRLIIDMSGIPFVDSAGLGALMLVQRKAAERRLTVCLRGANEELRFLLVLTKLDDLFELETGVA